MLGDSSVIFATILLLELNNALTTNKEHILYWEVIMLPMFVFVFHWAFLRGLSFLCLVPGRTF
jgi:hypothetical protein